MTIRIGGTLIVVAPMKNGIVVSADSLRTSTVPGVVNEDVQKIHVLADRPDLAFFVAGSVRFVPLVPDGVEPVQWMRNAPATYDVVEVIRNYLAGDSPKVINPEYIELLAARCKTHITDADSRDPFLGSPETEEGEAKDEELFIVAITQYISEEKRSIIGSFSIHLDAHGGICLPKPRYAEYSLAAPFTFKGFGGGSKYLKHSHARSSCPDFYGLFDSLSQTRIADLGEVNAVRFTRDAIDTAATINSRFDPTKTHVGGNVYTCTVDGVRLPSFTLLGQVKRS
jgi:hypothetical protein